MSLGHTAVINLGTRNGYPQDSERLQKPLDESEVSAKTMWSFQPILPASWRNSWHSVLPQELQPH